MSIRMAAACLVFNGPAIAACGTDSPRGIETRPVAPLKDHQSIARAPRERAGTKAPGNGSGNPWSALSNLTSGGSRNCGRRNAEEWRDVDAGVVQSAHVCYETGGEAYPPKVWVGEPGC
jgi:hypothetical protein